MRQATLLSYVFLAISMNQASAGPLPSFRVGIVSEPVLFKEHHSEVHKQIEMEKQGPLREQVRQAEEWLQKARARDNALKNGTYKLPGYDAQTSWDLQHKALAEARQRLSVATMVIRERSNEILASYRDKARADLLEVLPEIALKRGVVHVHLYTLETWHVHGPFAPCDIQYVPPPYGLPFPLEPYVDLTSDVQQAILERRKGK